MVAPSREEGVGPGEVASVTGLVSQAGFIEDGVVPDEAVLHVDRELLPLQDGFVLPHLLRPHDRALGGRCREDGHLLTERH